MTLKASQELIDAWLYLKISGSLAVAWPGGQCVFVCVGSWVVGAHPFLAQLLRHTEAWNQAASSGHGRRLSLRYPTNSIPHREQVAPTRVITLEGHHGLDWDAEGCMGLCGEVWGQLPELTERM